MDDHKKIKLILRFCKWLNVADIHPSHINQLDVEQFLKTEFKIPEPIIKDGK